MSELKNYQISEEIIANSPLHISKAIDLRTNEHVLLIQHVDMPPLKEPFSKFTEDLDINALPLRDIFQSKNDLYEVYEYNSGTPIKSFAKGNILSLAEKLSLIISFCELIQKVHRQALVFANINAFYAFYDRSKSCIKLAGSGFICNSDYKLTESQINDHLSGEVSYLAPEQTGKIEAFIDQRTDLYALGVVFYEMLCGVTPFQAADKKEMIYKIIAEFPDAPSNINPLVPDPLGDIALKLLEKMPQNRYQNIEDLIDDLTNCRDQLDSKGIITKFPLANNSSSTRPIIFGRNKELDLLISKFNALDATDKQIVYISGESGIGKSALVGELLKYLDLNDIIYSRSKLDQAELNVPFSGVFPWLSELVEYINGLPTSKKHQWKLDIESKLTSRSQLLIDLVPAFDSILGKHDKPPSVDLFESKVRLNNTLVDFFSLVSEKLGPIVLVIDDLQWVDDASLEIIDLLVNNSTLKNLLFIGIYRYAENVSNKLANQLIMSHTKTLEFCTSIILDKLPLQHVDELVNYEYVSKENNTTHLVEEIYQQTGGNPFHVKQVIYDLNLDKSTESGVNRAQEPAGSSELKIPGVVSLLSKRLESFTEDEITVLNVAALLGSRFTVDDLKLITKKSFLELESILYKLSHDKFIVINNKECRFSHDKFQQAVVSTLTQEDIVNLHWNIGISLWDSTTEKKRNERIYEIASHLDRGKQTAISDEMRNKLIEVNISAINKAFSDCAYSTALLYSNLIVDLLSNKHWSVKRLQYFTIFYSNAKALYLMGNTKAALAVIRKLLSSSSENSELVSCFTLMKDIYVNQGLDYSELIEQGLKILSSLGYKITLEKDALDKEINTLNIEIDNTLSSNNISFDNIYSLPLMTDEKARFLVKFFTHFWEAAFYTGNTKLMQFSVLQMVYLSLKKGNVVESSFAYVLYAALLCESEKFKKGFDIGYSAIKLNRTFNEESLIPSLNNLFANYTCYNVKPFSFSVDLYDESIVVAKKTGDYPFGVWAAFFKIWSMFLAGSELELILEEHNKLSKFVSQTNDMKMMQAMHMIKEFISSYSDSELNNGQVVDFDFDQKAQDWVRDNFLPGPAWYEIQKVQLLFAYEKYDEAIGYIGKYTDGLDVNIVMFPLSQKCFYQVMSLLFADKESNNPKLLLQCKDKLEKSALINPENFSYQNLLLEAKLLENDYQMSIKTYDRAIAVVESGESDYERALCYELKAKHLLKYNESDEAQFNFSKAVYYYEQWGGNRKALFLKDKYLKPQTYSDNVNRSFNRHDNGLVDIDTFVAVTVATCTEINLSRLLSKLLDIFIKHTFSQKAALFFVENGKIYWAGSNLSGVTKVHDNDLLLNPSMDIPVQIVQQTALQGKKVILGDAMESQDYRENIYIKSNNVRSLMCLPFYNHGEIIGVVYLENPFLKNVYHEYIGKTLDYLLSQISISIENAKLYSTLKKEVEVRNVLNKKLEENEARTKLSHQYAKVGNWEWNILTDELYWSESVKEILEYSPGNKKLTIEVFNSIIHPDDKEKVNSAIALALEGNDYYVEHRVLLKNKDVKWVSEAGNILRDENNKPTKMLGIVQDISARKEAEEKQHHLQLQLLQAQKMEALGQLTGGVAHDFNNILSSILGYAELTQVQLEKDTSNQNDKISSYLENIRKSGERARDLVAQMLIFSRGQNVEATIKPIDKLVKDAIKMLRSLIPSSVSVKINLCEEDINVSVNSVQFHQILMNMVINAKDAIPKNGTITITTERVFLTDEFCSGCNHSLEGDWIQLAICDDGEGMSKESQSRIFEPFYTTKDVGKGTGMGLSTVHGIVHNADGHIVVESELGNGTCFNVLLPEVKAFENEETAEIPVIEKSVGSKRILVVDDEETLGNFIHETLSYYGYDVTNMSFSEQAWEVFEANPNDFDLVLTDQTMPGLTGDALLLKIRSVRPDVPVIVMTGFHDSINEDTAIKAGFSGYVKKPFEIGVLLDVIGSQFIE